MFEGITNDGHFLIVSYGGISHPTTQQRWASGCATERTEAPADAQAHEINMLLGRNLATADPASFQPNLDQLDAVIRSLKLKR